MSFVTTSYKLVLDFSELNRRMVAKQRKILFRTAGFGLRVMRNNIKTRKSTSSVGGAPHSKTKKLKKATAFDVDLNEGEATIGFINFRSKVAKPLGGGTIAGKIDRGGRERLTIQAHTITRADGRPREIGPQTVTASYGPRPIIDPVRRPTQAKLLELAETTPL